MQVPILTALVFLPLAGALIIIFMNKKEEKSIKLLALEFASATFILSVVLWILFEKEASGFQFVEKYRWIESLGIQYYMGIDGISLPLIVLTTLLSMLAIIASWKIDLRVKHYFALLLLLETGMIGVFTSLDFILFYVFWEIVLVPMYFLIGVWGGPRREYAAIKFFLYTLLGSVIMLLGILGLYFITGLNTFNMIELISAPLSIVWQNIIFFALFIGFAVKVPIFPFHTWLPDAHVEAPTAVSVILAGVLLKMGSYAIIRISIPILPEAFERFAYFIAVIAIINIIYGALVAMAQKDLKKLVAYSSVSHMGYIMLGIAAGTTIGINGAVIQMFNHGIITGMLFLLVGAIYDRTHTREISKLGGLQGKIPLLAGILAFTSFASLGLPGLSGFIGELLVLVGTFPVYRTLAIIATIGIVLTAGYMLWMIQRVNLGTLSDKYKNLTDVNLRELATFIPLIILIVYIGVYPGYFLKIIDPAVSQILNIVRFAGGI